MSLKYQQNFTEKQANNYYKTYCDSISSVDCFN